MIKGPLFSTVVLNDHLQIREQVLGAETEFSTAIGTAPALHPITPRPQILT